MAEKSRLNNSPFPNTTQQMMYKVCGTQHKTAFATVQNRLSNANSSQSLQYANYLEHKINFIITYTKSLGRTCCYFSQHLICQDPSALFLCFPYSYPWNPLPCNVVSKLHEYLLLLGKILGLKLNISNIQSNTITNFPVSDYATSSIIQNSH